jgi:hypothetical protein
MGGVEKAGETSSASVSEAVRRLSQMGRKALAASASAKTMIFIIFYKYTIKEPALPLGSCME